MSMSQQEFSVFAAALRTYYSKEKILPNEQAVKLWYRQLKDIPFQVAETVLDKWVSCHQWSPTIADIRAEAAAILSGESDDWSQAWEDVIRQVHKFGSYAEADALNALDGLTRKAVERIGFRSICLSDNEAVIRANFRDVYNNMLKSKTEADKIPAAVQERISKLSVNAMKQLE